MYFSSNAWNNLTHEKMHNANLKYKKWGEFAKKENLPYRKKSGYTQNKHLIHYVLPIKLTTRFWHYLSLIKSNLKDK